MKYGYDYIDGARVPQLVVQNDLAIQKKHNGTIHVESGVLTINGTVNGTLDVQSGATVIIHGRQNGTVSVEAGAHVLIYGEVNGTTSVKQEGRITIERNGRMAGTCCNNGTVIIAGVFGGKQCGTGQWLLEDTGMIKQPIIKNGANYYRW